MSTAVAEPPAKVVIPPMSKLTGAGATEPVKPVAAAPVAAPVTPSVTPVAKVEDDGIDTQIVPGAPKTPADFAAERRGKKQSQTAEEIAEAQRRADEAKMLYTQKEAAYVELETAKKELERELSEQRTLAETRKTEIEGLQATYYDSNRVVLDPTADPEFTAAQQQMMNELRVNVPARVKGANGSEMRVLFDNIIQQNGASEGLGNILGAYGRAKQTGNEPAMDLAVNAFAKLIGADVDMTARDEKEWRLLPNNDPVFLSIETALNKALPHFQTTTGRLQSFQQNAPQLAKQQYEKRATNIRQNLTSAIFLPTETATARLKADQNDPLALFSQLVSHVPALKQQVEEKLAHYSATYAALPDRLNLPTLAGNDKVSIANHQNEVKRHREVQGEIMRNAVIGATIGPILATLISERDAAEARADAAANNTNPGGGRSGGAGGAVQPSIDTQIVKPGM